MSGVQAITQLGSPGKFSLEGAGQADIGSVRIALLRLIVDYNGLCVHAGHVVSGTSQALASSCPKGRWSLEAG